jgi:hypothetical protein
MRKVTVVIRESVLFIGTQFSNLYNGCPWKIRYSVLTSVWYVICTGVHIVLLPVYPWKASSDGKLQ